MKNTTIYHVDIVDTLFCRHYHLNTKLDYINKKTNKKSFLRVFYLFTRSYVILVHHHLEVRTWELLDPNGGVGVLGDVSLMRS